MCEAGASRGAGGFIRGSGAARGAGWNRLAPLTGASMRTMRERQSCVPVCSFWIELRKSSGTPGPSESDLRREEPCRLMPSAREKELEREMPLGTGEPRPGVTSPRLRAGDASRDTSGEALRDASREASRESR